MLHMIDEFIGVEPFRHGVGNYLRKHSYSNTVTSDLWEGLDGASEWPVSEIMETWVYQRGFPQIDVSVVDGGVQLHQRRHLVIPDETDTTLWKVPVHLRGSVDGEPYSEKVLVEEDETVVEIDGSIDWLVANGGGTGFYRTEYSPDLFSLLLDNVDQLDDNERYALLVDTLAFVKNGSEPASAFLDLAKQFEDETEQAIWSVVTGGLGLLEHHALNEAVRPQFEAFVRDLVGPALDRLGWETDAEESDLDRKLRGSLIGAMGNLGEDPAVIEKAKEIAMALLDGADPDPEVATAALAVYAKHGGADEYETLWSAYQAATAPLDQRRYLAAVAAVSEPEPAVSTLDKAVAGDIRTQDAFWVFARLLMGDAGPVVWESAGSRWDDVLATMPGHTRGRVAEGISALSQPEVAAGVRSFFAEHPVPEAARSIEQNLEKLDANVALRERETPTITGYFTA